jgi:subtilisin family serine protease
MMPSMPTALRTALIILAFAAPGPAAAQVQLPNVGGPVGGAVGAVGGALQQPVGQAQSTLGGLTEGAGEQLQDARETAQEALRREHRDVIDTDRAGNIVVRNEVVAIAPSEAALAAARARGFSVRETIDAASLGMSVVVLAAPEGMSTRRAVAALRELDPQGAYDFNHIYFGAGPGRSAPKQARQGVGAAAGGVRIGLIDSGVDANHAAFAAMHVEQRGFAAAHAMADAHGTAIASLLAGADGGFRGAAPGASLYVADVYGGRPTGGGAAAIVAAMAWLAQSRAGVINISLVGPPNRALEAAMRAAIARGHVIVAAVGNDGPSAPPLYPAAYPGVIGVTGVDARNRVLPEAERGAQVDFAAPGSDMAAAAPGGVYVAVRGTSYAAPIVAGLIARRLGGPNVDAAAHAQAELARAAADLGARGPDHTYGAGLVGEDVRIAPRVMARR